MQGACTTAAAAVNARIDAAALKAAEHRLGSKTSGGAAAPNAETVTMCRLLLRHLRAVKVCKRGQSSCYVMHQYIKSELCSSAFQKKNRKKST